MGRAAAQVLDPSSASLREAAIELPGKLILLRAEQLEPNPWNPNRQDDETFLKEKVSIRRFGFVVPIIARPHPDKDDIWQIIDGEHRLKAGAELQMVEYPTYDLGPISDHEAMQLTIVLNELRGKPEEKKLGEILKTLLNRETLDSLTEVLPYTKQDVGRIAQLPDFDWNQFKQRTQKAGDERMVERIFRLPVEANKNLNEALARMKGDRAISDSEALAALAGEFLDGA